MGPGVKVFPIIKFIKRHQEKAKKLMSVPDALLRVFIRKQYMYIIYHVDARVFKLWLDYHFLKLSVINHIHQQFTCFFAVVLIHWKTYFTSILSFVFGTCSDSTLARLQRHHLTNKTWPFGQYASVRTDRSNWEEIWPEALV